ncbi:mannitol dehydrogenase family protein [Sulfitobacter guttiformis]|uniref:Mannitol 2-dehydrogenase n=1 Tax=Sulfitobacter guttiformis TaxID=74349 RepID=A0A420DUK5_9RHOB|nr:mannitol dehydrogenase family protein [Sulfitobacter guttiformis]RKE97925.1 mannitol 2-dehydrogenase [Sulfitobacter guttiformis]
MKPSLANLAQLPCGIRKPAYNRADLSAGIVHIGLGNFHRAHQAWYRHRLFEAGIDHDWAIIGAGVRAGDAAQRDKLLAQDCLTTLIELAPNGKSAEVCASMIDFLPVQEGNAALIAQMTDPRIRIVSLTVTEGGYYIDAATGGFNAAHPDIVHDAAHPDRPVTAFGAMIAALRQRRDGGTGPFTCLSCDNLQGNGAVLRQAVVALARMSDMALAEWIGRTCSFPNSMVDCIVPATGAAEIALAKSFGIDDAVPVTHENFRQWVLEDDFCAGRPDWARVGVTFSDNVHGFETQKIRVLNGGHQVIAAAGELLSLATIAETMAHPQIRALLHKVVGEEVTPHMPRVPGYTPHEYLELVERRFSNLEIADTTRRVAFDGSSRQPGFIVPSIRKALDAGTPVSGLALVSALWARYCEGTREDGSPIAPNDPNWATLHRVAKAARSTPATWLEMRQFYGDLADDSRFADAFSRWLSLIYTSGVTSALAAYSDS